MFENEGDEFIGPEGACCCGQGGCWSAIDPISLERAFIVDEGDFSAQLRRCDFEMLDLFLRSFCEGFRPERAAAGERAPFAGDVVFFDVCFDGIVVAHLEGCHVGGGVEEQGLAMASILSREAYINTFQEQPRKEK